MKKNIELLSPVGSYESLLASIENGADAVYLGGKMFNARKYASNFDYDELREAVRYAHLNGVRVYVVVNILLRDDELRDILDYILFLYNIDVDALIIQDLGLYRIVKTLFKDFEIHGSTQMSINNFYGAMLLEKLGFKRVVLARELSLSEIREIHEKTQIELEIFVHGALCVSYSGQCLMSSMIGGRSGNRGTCAQPCRMKYTIVDSRNQRSIDKTFDEKHLISLKDLNALDDLSGIVNAGVTSLKVEGRMKKPEYVATVINLYRKKIDDLFENRDSRVNEADREKMAQMFNRGFTRGFLRDDFGLEIVTLDKPNNRGVFLGEVIEAGKRTVIRAEKDLSKGDGIEILTKSGEGIGLIVSDDLYKNTLTLESLRGVSVGDKVYKTLDVELNKEARETFEKVDKEKLELYMRITIRKGQKASLEVSDGRNSAKALSDSLVEEARNVSLSKERVKEQMEKLGNTPYVLRDIEIDLEEGSMIRVSELNKLRRLAVEELLDERVDFNKRDSLKREDLDEDIKTLFSFPKKKEGRKKISVSVDDIEKFNQLDLNKLNRVYLNFTSYLQEALSVLDERNDIEVYLGTSNIVENNDFESLKNTLDLVVDKLDGVSVSNLGSALFIKENYDTRVHADYELNIFNSQAVMTLKELGVRSATLSPELKLSQLRKISEKDLLEYEVIGYGHLTLMTLKHCPMAVIKNCKSTDNCESCNFREGYGLRDRKDLVFDFKRLGNTTVVYNSQAIVVVEHLKQIFKDNIDIVRLDFTSEENIREIQSLYFDFANDKIDLSVVEDEVEKLKTKRGITKGHFFRGVL